MTRFLPAASGLAVALTALASPALALEVPARALDFVVEREGRPIGHHTLIFHPGSDGSVAVDVETKVAVKAVFVTVYRFEHEGHEEWRNGQLVSLRSKTDDDGTDHQVNATASGQSLDVEADGGEHAVPEPVFPASLWNREALAQGHWLNTLTGKLMTVSIADLGTESIQGPDGSVPARHYRVTGDLTRDLWYDADGRLTAVAFDGQDGSAIRYRLQHVEPITAN